QGEEVAAGCGDDRLDDLARDAGRKAAPIIELEQVEIARASDPPDQPAECDEAGETRPQPPAADIGIFDAIMAGEADAEAEHEEQIAGDVDERVEPRAGGAGAVGGAGDLAVA